MNSKSTFFRSLAVVTVWTLLTASAALSQEKTLSVRGSLAGHGVGTIEGATLHAAGAGSGAATNIGAFTYVLTVTVNLPAGTSTGMFALAFANGDVLHGTFTGLGGGPSGHIVESLTINGGTGRFANATGNLTLDRLTDQSTLPAYETHTGIITGTINTSK
jgi:hypothetical protein